VDERTAEEERQLLERVQAGETGAYDELVRRYLRPAFAIAYRVLKQREDAEDVAQESLPAILETIHRFDTRRPFGPWLYRIVTNRALNARKSRSIRQAEPVAEEMVAPGESPQEASERSEARDRLEAEVQRRTCDLQRALDQKAALLHEVDHRVKNNLQMVSSLVLLKARRIPKTSSGKIQRHAAKAQYLASRPSGGSP